MVPRIYDTPRMVRILGEDETPGHEWINRPLADGRVHDLRVGKYDLVVSTGPAYQTMRQEAAEGMRDMAQAYPPLMQFAGDKMVKAMNWPDADVIAERFKKTIPPELTKGEDEKDPPPVPPEVEQQMQQMQQQLQQYDQALSDAMQQIKAAQGDQQTKIQEAQAKAGADIEIAKIKAMADIEAKRQVAEIEAANRPPEPEKVEPNANDQPDSTAQCVEMLTHAVAMLAAPKRKVMRIQAPSGGIYEGEVAEISEPMETGAAGEA